MRHLNLLNGTCAWEEWKKCDLPGEVLVWHENYLQGVLPVTDDLTEYNTIRARELHKHNPQFEEQGIFDELQAMHRILLSLKKEDHITLWFDVCPFDQAMEQRIMFLINRMSERPQVMLVKFDVVWSAETFLRHQNAGREIRSVTSTADDENIIFL